MAEKVTLKVEMEPEVAEQFAQFCKRSYFDMFLELTDPALPGEERKRQAYQMINGMQAIKKELNRAGFDPR